MKFRKIILAFAATLLAASSFAIPVHWKVDATGENGEYRLRITCYIESGWHIYDREYSTGRVYQTRISVTPAGPLVTKVGPIVDITPADRDFVTPTGLNVGIFKRMAIFEQKVRTTGSGPFLITVRAEYYAGRDGFEGISRSEEIEFRLDPATVLPPKTKKAKKEKRNKKADGKKVPAEETRQE